MNLYVGNLSFQATEDDVRQAFEAYGEVAAVNIIKDRYTDRSRGFCFVEMSSDSEAKAAMEGVKEIKGREVVVNEARPRQEGARRDSRDSGNR